jgi:aspartyl protease family protein
MSPEEGSSLVWSVIVGVMLIGSLIARRLPLGQVMKMVLAWVAIFCAIFVVFSFRAELFMVWQRVKSELAGTANQRMDGKELRLTRDDSGHFKVRSKVNGRPVDFMIDSGATYTSMSIEAARQAGIVVDTNAIPTFVETANGRAKVWRAEISQFDVGGIRTNNHFILVGEGLGDTNLLGMNFLDGLSGWKVQGQEMVLTP